jgi:predicted nucleic acid-binding protein
VAQTLILDSEAVNALARPTERGALAGRARAILQVAYEEHALVRVPAPVLAEVCRGPRFDAPVERLLTGRGVGVVDLTDTMAKRAGALLAKAKLGSAHAVDAFVVATAIELGGAIIATGDPTNLSRLASGQRQVRILAI